MNSILFKGAEADIILNKKENHILKDRKPKTYRLKILDEKIRKQRTKAERKLLEKASKIIPVPKVLENEEKDDFKIKMENIEGKKLSDNLDNFFEKKQLEIMKEIGENIAKLHDENIIHGDLTTSNMILNEGDRKIYFIDFGLGFISTKIEDRAVDLYLLKEALEAKHFQNWKKLLNAVEKGYSASKDNKRVLEQLKKVSSRGRYKEKY